MDKKESEEPNFSGKLGQYQVNQIEPLNLKGRVKHIEQEAKPECAGCAYEYETCSHWDSEKQKCEIKEEIIEQEAKPERTARQCAEMGCQGCSVCKPEQEAKPEVDNGFNEWWEDQTKGSNQWSTLERLSAKDAWEEATRRANCE